MCAARPSNFFMKILILLFAAFLAISSTHAADLSPRQRADQFFSRLMQGDVDKAYADLFVGSMNEDSSKLEQAKRQIAENLSKYGKQLGYELVIEKPFGASVVRLVYILKMEKHPIVWEFFFYHPKDIWFLANFDVNDEFKGLRDFASPPKT